MNHQMESQAKMNQNLVAYDRLINKGSSTKVRESYDNRQSNI